MSSILCKMWEIVKAKKRKNCLKAQAQRKCPLAVCRQNMSIKHDTQPDVQRVASYSCDNP